jgi:hypothetical protein
MTREELKTTLASKANKLAGQAIEAIKKGESLEELQKLVEAGASDRYYYRDPAHPRSKFRVSHVLDACFDSKFGATETGPTSITLGHIQAQAGRAAHFAYLLDKDFSPGENGWRGPLMRAIINACFYRNESEEGAAMELAPIAIAKGKIDIQLFAENSYEWTGSLEKLERVLALGAKPTSKMMECALRYSVCAANSGDPVTGRADVIKKLAEAGCRPPSAEEKDAMRMSRDLWQWLETQSLETLLFPELAESVKQAAKDAYPGEDWEEALQRSRSMHGETPTFRLSERLKDAEAEFQSRGGRGVALAEEIDVLRVTLAAREAIEKRAELRAA